MFVTKVGLLECFDIVTLRIHVDQGRNRSVYGQMIQVIARWIMENHASVQQKKTFSHACNAIHIPLRLVAHKVLG